MTYPLNMHNLATGGYAVASDAEEHQRLTDAGYWPPLEVAETEEPAATDEPVKRGPGRPRKVQ